MLKVNGVNNKNTRNVMFPRIKNSETRGKRYEYLLISESVWRKGKSTTRDIAQLGNLENLDKSKIQQLISGLSRLFEIDDFKTSNDIDVLESLEHGNIILWRKLWNILKIGQTIKKEVKKKNKRVSLDVSKYIEMMVVNRNSEPLSKLAVTRWKEITSYKYIKGYSSLNNNVEYFYRAMDYLLEIKDEVELAIFKKLRNLFSVNVKMTFYDIISTFFYSDKCPITENGHSRDNRPDLKQIVIGVVTSYEGFPIKHYVFTGNTKDETTVRKVIEDLKKEFNIEETTFVGDRGMITKLNIENIEDEGFDYIMGVKVRQNEIMDMVFDRQEILNSSYQDYKTLKIQEQILHNKDFLLWKTKNILNTSGKNYKENDFLILKNLIWKLDNNSSVKYKAFKSVLEVLDKNSDDKIRKKIFTLIKKYEGKYNQTRRVVICLNNERKAASKRKRNKKIHKFSEELQDLLLKHNQQLNKNRKGKKSLEMKVRDLFSGYKKRYRKFFVLDNLNTKKQVSTKIRFNNTEILNAEKLDGIFVLTSSLTKEEISKEKIVDSYKNLREVEDLFDDLKNFVDINPVRHWLEERVRSHVFICILALLLKRLFEIEYFKGKQGITTALEEIAKSKLIRHRIRNYASDKDKFSEFNSVTIPTKEQEQIFKMVGINSPASLEKIAW